MSRRKTLAWLTPGHPVHDVIPLIGMCAMALGVSIAKRLWVCTGVNAIVFSSIVIFIVLVLRRERRKRMGEIEVEFESPTVATFIFNDGDAGAGHGHGHGPDTPDTYRQAEPCATDDGEMR